ncbi:AI-2E family transporter [Paenibacillus sp. MY03]|uniref:AI-2E family transporter n=1 Tax=Paenibacillus sp. MY03 TaxID=302980 RepID=UPI0015C58FBC|nr:AI-2E family transporter [Paenibacillus sp. MY03]
MTQRQHIWFRRLAGAILVMLLLYLIHLNRGLFAPIGSIFNALFFPFAASVIMYYMLRPIVGMLERRKVPRGFAVLLVYLASGLLLTIIVLTAGPFLQSQFLTFVEQVPEMVKFVSNGMESLKESQETLSPEIRDALPNVSQDLGAEWNRYASSIANSLVRAFGWMSNALVMLSLVPFILFYALKDGDQFSARLLELAPTNRRARVAAMLQELDETIASFIRGKAVVCLIVGILLLAGYAIIGLEYALVLAVIGMLANLIPFFGPFIGAAPAVLVALFQDPVKALYVVLITVLVQQIENNLISPQVMGRTLDIHPVTVIALILAAGSVTGLVGILFVVPVYAAAKVIFRHIRAMVAEGDNVTSMGPSDVGPQ